jgi:hypothetical protein
MGKGALMLGATSRQSTGDNLTAFGNEISQRFWVFIAYYQTGVRTKPANFPAMVYSSFSSRFAVFSMTFRAS